MPTVDADPARIRDFSDVASQLAGITTLSYIEPLEQVAIFALVKYFLLCGVISDAEGRRGQNEIRSDWKAAYAKYLHRERQLMRTLAVIMSVS